MASTHTLDGDDVLIGDTVFGVGYGPGKVTELLVEGRFRVDFAVSGRTATFDMDGVLTRQTARSLFWADPVLAVPRKNQANWSRIVPVVRALITAYNQGLPA